MKKEAALTIFYDQSILSFYKHVKHINRTFIEDKSDLYSYDFIAGAPRDSRKIKCKIGVEKDLAMSEFPKNFKNEGSENCNSQIPKVSPEIKEVKNIFKQKLKKSLANTPQFDF
jgi:hypothetical protein